MTISKLLDSLNDFEVIFLAVKVLCLNQSEQKLKLSFSIIRTHKSETLLRSLKLESISKRYFNNPHTR